MKPDYEAMWYELKGMLLNDKEALERLIPKDSNDGEEAYREGNLSGMYTQVRKTISKIIELEKRTTVPEVFEAFDKAYSDLNDLKPVYQAEVTK
jgi:hypothetical protein